MISPSTAPGTEIVCHRAGAFAHQGWLLPDLSDVLDDGRIYLLDAVIHDLVLDYPIVRLVGLVNAYAVHGGFHPARFRRAHLPSEILSCLTANEARIPDPAVVAIQDERRGRECVTQNAASPGLSCASARGLADLQSEFDFVAPPSAAFRFALQSFSTRHAAKPSVSKESSSPAFLSVTSTPHCFSPCERTTGVKVNERQPAVPSLFA